MKRFVVVITVLTLTLSVLSGFAVYAQPFHLAGDENEAPFGYINDQGQFVGIFVDIMAEAFKRMDIELEHKPYPWKRAQMLVEKGRADGMITVATPERLTYTAPTNFPIAVFEWVAFTREDHPQREQIMNATTLEELQEFTILDYIGDGWGEEHLQDMTVDRAGNLSQVLKKLAAGRGDVFIQSKLITQYTLHQLQQQPENEQFDLERVVNASNAFYALEFKLLIAKTSPYLDKIPLIDETLRGMQEDGTMQAIRDKYIAE